MERGGSATRLGTAAAPDLRSSIWNGGVRLHHMLLWDVELTATARSCSDQRTHRCCTRSVSLGAIVRNTSGAYIGPSTGPMKLCMRTWSGEESMSEPRESVRSQCKQGERESTLTRGEHVRDDLQSLLALRIRVNHCKTHPAGVGERCRSEEPSELWLSPAVSVSAISVDDFSSSQNGR